jgi:hypothetical protein
MSLKPFEYVPLGHTWQVFGAVALAPYPARKGGCMHTMSGQPQHGTSSVYTLLSYGISQPQFTGKVRSHHGAHDTAVPTHGANDTATLLQAAS